MTITLTLASGKVIELTADELREIAGVLAPVQSTPQWIPSYPVSPNPWAVPFAPTYPLTPWVTYTKATSGYVDTFDSTATAFKQFN